MIPRIISVCNLKGGAGKSTIAVNLACALRARTGVDCILVDADRQATALTWAENGELGVRVTSRVLHEAKPDDAHPGLLWVTQINMLAAKNPSVIIDLPPGLEYSLAAVAAISDLIFVPVNPSGVDFHSTVRFIKLVQKTREIRGSDKPGCVIVPNRLDRRMTIARKMSLYEQFGEPIAPPIGMRAAFVYAFDQGRWVGEVSPRSAAHREIEQLVSVILGESAAAGTETAPQPIEAPTTVKCTGRRKRAAAAPQAAVRDEAENLGKPETEPVDEVDRDQSRGQRATEPDTPASVDGKRHAGDAGAEDRLDDDEKRELAEADVTRREHGEPEPVPVAGDHDSQDPRLGDQADGDPVPDHAVGDDDGFDREQDPDLGLATGDNGRGGGTEGVEVVVSMREDGEDADHSADEDGDDEDDGGHRIGGDGESSVAPKPAHGAIVSAADREAI